MFPLAGVSIGQTHGRHDVERRDRFRPARGPRAFVTRREVSGPGHGNPIRESNDREGGAIDRRTSGRITAGVLAAALTIATATGCAANGGAGRSGSDQPGVDPPQASAGSTERASIATSSVKDVQAALRANDVDDPEHWAQVVYEGRPYPQGAAGEQRIRDVLTQHGAEPHVADGVLRTVTP